jgi:hypothetical protein
MKSKQHQEDTTHLPFTVNNNNNNNNNILPHQKLEKRKGRAIETLSKRI